MANYISYEVLKENFPLREEIIRNHSFPTPDRQLEIDLERGHGHVIED